MSLLKLGYAGGGATTTTTTTTTNNNNNNNNTYNQYNITNILTNHQQPTTNKRPLCFLSPSIQRKKEEEILICRVFLKKNLRGAKTFHISTTSLASAGRITKSSGVLRRAPELQRGETVRVYFLAEKRFLPTWGCPAVNGCLTSL